MLPGPPGAWTATIQRAQAFGNSAPSDFTNYTIMSLGQHQKAVQQGADQIALPLFALNPNKGKKSDAQALIIPTVDFAKRSDTDYMELSAQNIEEQTWKTTKEMQDRSANGQSNSSHFAKQTEVVGEVAAFNAFARKYPQYKSAFAIDPGHGTGIDQLWIESNPNGTVKTYMIVEAKGPNQSLASNQMTTSWVTSRMQSMSKTKDPHVAGVAALVVAALGQNGDGAAVPYVKGCVITARFADNLGNITCSMSNKRDYN
jgi:hypothetical protein